MYSRGKTIAKLVNGMDQFKDQSRVGDILVTARVNAYNGVAFADNLNLFRRCMQKLFKKGLTVVTRSDSGRLHCHIAVELDDSCSDFDWVAWKQAERYYDLYSAFQSSSDLKFYVYYTKKYRASLPESWRKLNLKLMAAGKKYGLGRISITPVRKNLTAMKWYYVSNIPYKRDLRDKGVRYYSSWGLESINGFQILNKYTRGYWARLRKFSEGLQLNSENYNICLRSVLGRRWFFRCKDLIKDIDKLSTAQVMEYNELRSAIQLHLLRSS